MQNDRRDLLASEIKLARVKLNMTQDDLVKLTGLSNATIVSLENGTRKANANTIIKICQALGINNKKMRTLL